MKKLAVVSILLLAAAGPALLAQDGEPPLVQVLEVEVPLAQSSQYEAAVKELFAIYGKEKFGFPIFARQSTSRPGHYTFATAMNSYDDLADDDALTAAVAATMKKVTSASESFDSSVWASRPDLSYVPSTPRVAPDQATFTRISFLRPHRGRALDFEGVIKEAAAMYRKHGIQDGLAVWQLTVGEGGPAFAILTDARNEADFYAQAEKNQAKMTGDWQAILAKSGPMLRAVELEGSINRPDLSYQP